MSAEGLQAMVRSVLLATIPLFAACAREPGPEVAASGQPRYGCGQAEPGSRSETVEICRAWREYLDSRGGFYSRCWVPSTLWRKAEREMWPCFDLASSAVPPGTTPEDISIERADSGGEPEYRVRTR